MIDGDQIVYIPRKKIRTTSDVSVFLTKHRLFHPSVPQIPMSISHCWINTEFEREKLSLGDDGHENIVEVARHVI
jgi:hypothetical protein